MTQLNPLEIVKRLPRTNCGDCGYPSCLAFAMALLSGATTPAKCPHGDPQALNELVPEKPLPEEDYAWRILEEVKEKAKALNWDELPSRTGGRLSQDGLRLPFLDGEVIISADKALRLDGLELDPRDQILLYNYLLMAKAQDPLEVFVGLESFPHSISKVQTLRRYAEERCAEAFSGRLKALKQALSRLRVSFPKDCPADLCAVVWVLPKLPLRLHFFEAEPEEGLSAEVKILYPQNALSFLDIESLVFCAERLVERLLEIADGEG